jgi:hypothetical protein
MKSRHPVTALLLSLLLLVTPFTQIHAAIVSNAQFIQQTQVMNDRAELLQLINRSDVQQQLLELGADISDIENRINNMTQQELAQLDQHISQLPAGGDALGLVVLIFIIFVITDVIGATDIFPFIHPVK